MLDLVGKTFGLLTVIGRVDDYVNPAGHHLTMWKCQCECGNIVVTRGSSLTSGHTKGCGQKHRAYEDLTGQRFGRLTVVSRGDNETLTNGHQQIRWNCLCDCGGTTLARGTSLKSGHTTSCGRCTRSESNSGKHLVDISGKKYGRWTVLEQVGRLKEPRGRYVVLWKCQCECGEIRNLRAGTLKRGLSLSCGCYKYEQLGKIAKQGTRGSRLESVVNKYLQDKGFYYEPQKIYKNLRGKLGYPLSYDFLVYIEGVPKLLIECQGKQHYEPVEYFGGDKQFEVQKQNDETKREFAKENDLDLLEIPYNFTDDDIIQLLDAYFGAKGLV